MQILSTIRKKIAVGEAWLYKYPARLLSNLFSRKPKARANNQDEEKMSKRGNWHLRGGGLSDDRARKSIEIDDTSIESMLKSAPYIQWDGNQLFTIPKGHIEGMRSSASFYANKPLLKQVLKEMLENQANGSKGGFLSAIQQLSNVATLPGVVSSSIGMPDIHSGYGFAIGNVAAVDMDDDDSVVSPGGVGFDINCGVRLLRTNLHERDVIGDAALKNRLADLLFKNIPVGVGEGSVLGQADGKELDDILRRGMAWAEERNLCWPEDREVVEERGSFEGADPDAVSDRAKARGRNQCGSLGSGNHYAEVQVVEEVYDEEAASAMGLKLGTVCIMLHSGSRGLGHQVCTDAVAEAEKVMKQQGISVVDRQLACCRIKSKEGQKYLAAMRAAANFAFVNRCLMAKAVRQSFATIFERDEKELGMSTVYDVSHNIAKVEEHMVDGVKKKVLVHRKGATRAFGPGSPEICDKYRSIGQPVLVGGSMGTCSYVLTGTAKAMESTFGSTCHGAGRAMSRSQAMRSLDSRAVLKEVEDRGCTARVATKKLVAEEAPQSYKDVSEVIETCHAAGISRKCVKLRPVICIKG